MMTVLQYLLSLAVLAALLGALMYITKAFKAQKDTAEKTACVKKASLFFLGYLLLNALRLYVESGLK